MSPKHYIYLDHAAATPLDPRVKTAMEPFWETDFGNPSSLYTPGQRAKAAVSDSRLRIARILGCEPAEIIFTGSGSESDNLAILGLCRAVEEAQTNKSKTAQKPHLIASAIEHQAVLAPFQYLEQKGYSVTYLPVTKEGFVEVETVRQAIRPETLLVSIMYANNEVGTVQPIAEIGQLCQERGIYFHTDACQAAGALPLKASRLNVNLLTLNASKIYGPKGVGLLYVRQGTPLKPLIYGGGQEKGLRSGTENVPGIVGLAKALELVEANKAAENQRLIELRDYFYNELHRRVPDSSLNGHPTKRLPNNLNLVIPGVEAEAFILLMDQSGIACSAGSACDTANFDPSHVLLALGLDQSQVQSSIRFTLGQRTSKSDLDYTVRAAVAAIQQLRK